MLKTLLEGLFPIKCITCAKAGAWICTKHQNVSPAPKNKVDYRYLDHVYVATAYQDTTIKKCIEKFKFNNARYLSKPLAQIISKNLTPDLLQDATIIPIPLHWRRKLWRGYNQSTLLAKALKQIHPQVQINTRLLVRKKSTHQQARLSKSERKTNIKAAFQVKSPITKNIVLLDDVVASGATLDEAARALKNAGAMNVSAVVLARGG